MYVFIYSISLNNYEILWEESTRSFAEVSYYITEMKRNIETSLSGLLQCFEHNFL